MEGNETYFSDKSKSNKKTTLIEGDDIISQDNIVAETFNDFFANTVKNVDIKGYHEAYIPNDNWKFIENSIEKFKNHPSILQINKNVQVAEKCSFSTINEHDIDTVILKLNTHKPTKYP